MIFFTTSTLFLVGQVNYLNTRLPHLLLSFAAFENSFLADFEQFCFIAIANLKDYKCHACYQLKQQR